MDLSSLEKQLAPATLSGSASVPKTDAGAEKDKKLKKACGDFEAMLVFQMLKTMRQTVPKGGLFEQSHAKDTYDMLLDQKIADEIARKGQGLGLQKLLYQQLTREKQKPD